MQIKEALKIAIKELEDVQIVSSHLDARLLMAKALEQSAEYVLLNFDKKLNTDQQKQFFTLIEQRKSYEPVAYITGKKEFYGRNFLVDKRVLIPRSETEILIDGAIEYFRQLPQNEEVKILDLGTGSGIIAITLAAEVPIARITAIDISTEIIKLARENAARHNVSQQIEFIVSDWYKDIPLNDYDMIVSNPPYISGRERGYIAQETLLYEPGKALFASDNGLSEYKIIIGETARYLSPVGCLLLEIGFKQFELVSKIVENNNFVIDKVFYDLQGHKRAIRISGLRE